ncbi:MAG: phosphate butyryltransferase [Candidatus Eisenbacteria bacterium]|nr:phosphate butyryltransferase [Candidatus Eisenbacteria bacterium]
MSSDNTLRTFEELRLRARESGPKRVAVVVADDEVALTAISLAVEQGIAEAVLVGDGKKIRGKAEALGLGALAARATFVAAAGPEEAAAAAVARVRGGEVDILLKGHLRTDQLLRAVLDKERGLRTGRTLSDVLLYEDVCSGGRRLVGITDGGLNVLPTLEQKREIVENALPVMRALGIDRPRVAVMSATEAVSEKLPSTVDARELTRMGEEGVFGDAEVYGPLALDNALLLSAAEAKGITSVVAGRADVMVVPNIEAGNLLGKGVKYLGGSACGHVIMGATVPVLIPSRVESAEDKLNAVALGVIIHAGA